MTAWWWWGATRTLAEWERTWLSRVAWCVWNVEKERKINDLTRHTLVALKKSINLIFFLRFFFPPMPTSPWVSKVAPLESERKREIEKLTLKTPKKSPFMKKFCYPFLLVRLSLCEALRSLLCFFLFLHYRKSQQKPGRILILRMKDHN